MVPAIELQSVSKSYHTGSVVTPALHEVTLTVYPGELLMLVGPSGCGKTTLISIMAGILDHDNGSVRVFGNDLRQMSEDERTTYRGSTVGFVFQSYNLIPTLSVEDNVAIPLLLNGIDQSRAVARAREVLIQVGLDKKMQNPPSELSGGQQQRVAIARALVHKPKLIVCDEPTSALDHTTGDDIMVLLRKEALADRRTLVIVTHDSRIFKYADRIATMDDGSIVTVSKSPDSV